MDRRILFALVASYLVGTMFNLVPDTDARNYFLFSGVELTLKTHFYFICEHASKILLMYALCLSLKVKGIELFFWVEVLDFVDYLVCYNSNWFSFVGYPMGFNDFKIVLILVFMIQSLWKYRS